jgi:hypothetical protein
MILLLLSNHIMILLLSNVTIQSQTGKNET